MSTPAPQPTFWPSDALALAYSRCPRKMETVLARWLRHLRGSPKPQLQIALQFAVTKALSRIFWRYASKPALVLDRQLEAQLSAEIERHLGLEPGRPRVVLATRILGELKQGLAQGGSLPIEGGHTSWEDGALVVRMRTRPGYPAEASLAA